MSFTSPVAALDAVAAALQPSSRRPVHVGSQNTGLTLDCCCEQCDGPLIRVESAATRPKEGVAGLYGLSKNRCRDLVVDITVTWSWCWQGFADDGPDVAAIADTTKQGRANIMSWWEALAVLADSTAINQSVRFVSAEDADPEGGCFGWSMRLEADVSLCR